LSARDGVRERVAGLAMGGDDYVTKPFSLDEVLERIRAVLRRTGPATPATRLRVAGLELDQDSHEVKRDGALIALTPTEFRLLRGRLPEASLRVRVMAAAALLVALTSLVTGFLGTALLRSYLYSRADAQLRHFAAVASRVLERSDRPVRPTGSQQTLPTQF